MAFVWTVLCLYLSNTVLFLINCEEHSDKYKGFPKSYATQFSYTHENDKTQSTSFKYSSENQTFVTIAGEEKSKSTISKISRNSQTFGITIEGCYNWESLNSSKFAFNKIPFENKTKNMAVEDCICQCEKFDRSRIYYILKNPLCYCFEDKELSVDREDELSECYGQRFLTESDYKVVMFKKVDISTSPEGNIKAEDISLKSKCEERVFSKCINRDASSSCLAKLNQFNKMTWETLCKHAAMVSCRKPGIERETTLFIAIIIAAEFGLTVLTLFCIIREKIKKKRTQNRNIGQTVSNQDSIRTHSSSPLPNTASFIIKNSTESRQRALSFLNESLDFVCESSESSNEGFSGNHNSAIQMDGPKRECNTLDIDETSFSIDPNAECLNHILNESDPSNPSIYLVGSVVSPSFLEPMVTKNPCVINFNELVSHEQKDVSHVNGRRLNPREFDSIQEDDTSSTKRVEFSLKKGSLCGRESQLSSGDMCQD